MLLATCKQKCCIEILMQRTEVLFYFLLSFEWRMREQESSFLKIEPRSGTMYPGERQVSCKVDLPETCKSNR